jgi:ribosomal protein L35
MRKSFAKRIKITKTGKMMRRKMAQDHFRSNKSGKQVRDKRGDLNTKKVDIKAFLKLKHKGVLR